MIDQTNQRDVVRVGIIGAGAVGQRHARTLATVVPAVRVVAVSETDPSRAAGLAEIVGGARQVADPHQLIASTSVDAVLVASPDHTHHAFVRHCLETGKPVFCEKPLADAAEDGRDIVAMESTLGRRLVQVGFMRRFDRGYRELRRAFTSGVIGAPVMVHAAHRNRTAPPSFTSSMVFTNSASHDFDIIRWLLGENITEVYVRTPRVRAASDALQPAQIIVMTTQSGVVATVDLYLTASYGYDVRCEVVGDRGTASLRTPAAATVVTDGAYRRPTPSDWWERFADAYADELRLWVEGVRTGTTRGPSAWDGHVALLVAEACLAAARTGGTVQVSAPPTPSLYAP